MRSRAARALWNRLLGSRGERLAARYLRRLGIRAILRGYRCPPFGEIDLIARDGQTLVFVEVKTRTEGNPAEAVTPEKQRRLTRAAEVFLDRHHLRDVPCRFDVVAIRWPDGRGEPEVRHYRNAFEAHD